MNNELRWEHGTTDRTKPLQVAGASEDFTRLPTFKTRAPLQIFFDFTYLCNLECRHCVTNSSPKVERKTELSSERIMFIISDLASIGVLELVIGGGEPLCHPDIFSFLTQIAKVGLKTRLTTNGTLVTSDVAKRFREIGLSEVRVSFDGSQLVHDGIRGAGRYTKAMDAVRILVHNDVPTVPRVTLCNDDKAGIDTLFNDILSTGITSIKLSPVESSWEGSINGESIPFQISEEYRYSHVAYRVSKKERS